MGEIAANSWSHDKIQPMESRGLVAKESIIFQQMLKNTIRYWFVLAGGIIFEKKKKKCSVANCLTSLFRVGGYVSPFMSNNGDLHADILPGPW